MSIGERSHKLTTFEVENVGRLGVEGDYLIDQPAASIMGGDDGGPMARKGIVKDYLLQNCISRRVFHLQAPS